MSKDVHAVKTSEGLPSEGITLPGLTQLLSLREASAYLRLSTVAVRQLIEDKALHAIDASAGRNPTGRRTLRIPLSEMERFVRVNSTQPLNDT